MRRLSTALMSWPTHQSGPCVASRSVQPTHALFRPLLLRSLFSFFSQTTNLSLILMPLLSLILSFPLFFPFFLTLYQAAAAAASSTHPLADLIRVAGVSPHPSTHAIAVYCTLAEVLYFPSPAHTLLKACTLPTLASPRTKPPGLFAPWISPLFPCLQAVMLLRQLLTMLERLAHGTSLDNATKM